MNNYIFRLLLAISGCVFLHLALNTQATAQIPRHMVIYGGFENADIVPIAENIDFLVVGKISAFQLKQLKNINPDIIILKYFNTLGVYTSYPEWRIVNQHETWFARDKISGRRLTQRNRGWFLMNIANADWRRFTAEKIAKQTDSLYNGVFIDNFWDRFIRKFVAEGTTQPALPSQAFMLSWTQHMIALLIQIRAVYPKLIFINGTHKPYIKYVDGCMDESFVHSNWTSDTTFHNPSAYLQSLKKIQDIAKLGKTILAQSGSRGDEISRITNIYRLCFASYLMVWDKHISFNFHPYYTYSYKGLYQIDDYRLNLGSPLGNYYPYKEGSLPPNLIPNGNYNKGLTDWQVLSGNPAPDSNNSISGLSVRFRGSPTRSDKIGSGFISVKGGTEYKILADVKSEKNISVSQRYKRFGLQGRFYDINHNQIPARFNLLFNAGNYDWLPAETTLISPPDAAYVQLKIGFGAGGIGKVWIDNIYFGLAKKREMIFRRDFSKGSVFVNYGNKKTTVNLKPKGAAQHLDFMTLNPREGKILQHPPGSQK